MRIRNVMLVGCLSVGVSACTGGFSVDGVAFRGTIEAQSMEPTLKRGDKVIATEIKDGGPQRGDIVVYDNPGRWLAGPEGEGTLVHRVIGTPGDTIVCCDSAGRLAVNGEALDEPYLAPDPGRCDAEIPLRALLRPGTSLNAPCDWTVGPVPEASLFVLGDNRAHAADSRFHLCPPDEDPCAESPWVPADLVRGVVEDR